MGAGSVCQPLSHKVDKSYMKRLLIYLMLPLALWACDGLMTGPEITLTSGQEDNLILPSDESDFDITFTSTMAWKAGVEYNDGQSDWLSLSQKMGNGSDSEVAIKVQAFANKADVKRNATIVISSGAVSMNIYVTQKSKAEDDAETELVFELTDNNVEVSADGGRIKVTVRYNVEYECSENADWIREVKTRSYEEKTHTFDIEPNDSDTPRTAVITFCGNNLCIPFTVKQFADEDYPGTPGGGTDTPGDGTDNPGDGNDNPGDEQQPIVFELLDFSTDLASEGGNFVVRVNSTVSHECQTDVSWIQETSRTVSGTITSYTFNASSNPGDMRSTVIKFCAADRCLPFVVNQAAAQSSPELYVDKTNIAVDYTGTIDPIVVNVTSNTFWEAFVNSSWCRVIPSEGMNDGEFQIIADANETAEQRIANIYVSTADASIVRTLVVTQAPVPENDDDVAWAEMEFYHRSLVMRFTADWCGYCPMMATAMEFVQAEMPDKIEAVAVHGYNSSLATEYSLTLDANYPISGYPSALVDCMTYVENSSSTAVTKSNIINAVNYTESNYTAYTTTSWTSYVSNDQLSVDLTAYFKKSGNYRITVLVLKDNVVGYQADYNGGTRYDYVHSGLIVGAFTDVLGNSFSVERNNTVREFNYTIGLSSGYDLDSHRILVYIQREEGGAYYVDNAASENVGDSHAFEIVEDGVRGEVEGIVPGDDIIL